MCRLDRIDRIPAGCHRNAKLLHNTSECLIALGKPDAIARIKYRTFRLTYLFDDLIDHTLCYRNRHLCGILRRIVASQIVRLNITALIIHRNVDPYRTSSAGHCQMICLLQRITDLHRILDHHGIFAHAVDRFCNIKLLIAHGTKRQSIREPAHITCCRVIADLSGDHEHRHGIKPSANHAGNCIGSARSGGHTECRHPVMNAGIRLCRNGTALLMMIVKTVHAFLVSKCIIQMHGTAACHHKTVCNSMIYQKICYIIC